MKTNLFILSIVVFGMMFPVLSQAQSVRDEQYEPIIRQALDSLESASNAAKLQQAGNLFERISKKYPEEWIPVYYGAYCTVQSVFYDMASPRNELKLKNATDIIERLSQFPEADLSEINTLKGYSLMAKIALNPQENGQKYYAEVIRLFEKAIAQNPENPRPVVLLADFEKRLPAFIRSDKRNPEEEMAKAALLFGKETPSIEKPYWGKYFL